MSTLNQRRLDMARQIAQKLVVSGGMSDLPDLHHRPLSQSYPSENGALVQIVPEEVSSWSSHGLPWSVDTSAKVPASPPIQ